MNADLLDKFYRGECSPDEVRTVLEWFRASSPGPEQEALLQDLWLEAGDAEVAEDHDAASVFSQIMAQIQEQEHERLAAQEEEPVIRYMQPSQLWLKAAAAIVLPLCLLWALLHYAPQPRQKAAAYTTVEAVPGTRKTVHLPDGSVITLNAGSRISFQRDFAGEKREIVLRGEAFFEVAKDSLRPFIVHTGSISTQALGTSFNINYCPKNDELSVALATGVVQIDKQSQGRKGQRRLTRLVPGQQLSFDSTRRRYAVASFDKAEVLGWREGVLNFRNANMGQVIRKLEKWYGVEIEVQAQRLQDTAWNYTGVYDRESLKKVLEGIGYVKGFTYNRSDDKVKIVFNQPTNI